MAGGRGGRGQNRKKNKKKEKQKRSVETWLDDQEHRCKWIQDPRQVVSTIDQRTSSSSSCCYPLSACRLLWSVWVATMLLLWAWAASEGRASERARAGQEDRCRQTLDDIIRWWGIHCVLFDCGFLPLKCLFNWVFFSIHNILRAFFIEFFFSSTTS